MCFSTIYSNVRASFGIQYVCFHTAVFFKHNLMPWEWESLDTEQQYQTWLESYSLVRGESQTPFKIQEFST